DLRYNNDNVWKSVKSGYIGGFSIMDIPKAMKSREIAKSSDKRTKLKNLGDDWIVNFVSLVDEPAVPKATFVAIKSKKQDEKEEKGILKSIKELLASLVEKEELEGNQEPKDDEGGDITLTAEELQKIIEETVKKTVVEVLEKLQDEPEDDQETDDESETEEKEELEKRLQEVEKALKNRPKGI